jgi:hypothetical protein
MRRIVQYPPATHYSDLNISPQWHQWLRHTRREPPSIAEQSQDLIRQENLKVLSAQADARWAAKPSFLDKPGEGRGQAIPALGAGAGAGAGFGCFGGGGGGGGGEGREWKACSWEGDGTAARAWLGRGGESENS